QQPDPWNQSNQKKKLIKPLLTTTEITDIDNPTPGISQTRSKKLIKPLLTTTEITYINKLTPGASQTSQEKLNHHHLTNTEITHNNTLTPGISQTRRTKLNHHSLIKAHPITRYQMEEDFKQPKQTLKKNAFSVSLQAAKYRNACKVDSHSNQIRNTFNVQIGPPVTAKLLGENESLEEFFTKNIEEATKLHISFSSITNPGSLSTPGHQLNCQKREPFLAQPSEKKQNSKLDNYKIQPQKLFDNTAPKYLWAKKKIR
ncbi:hypothetical protein J6590_054966, partial [Homalodisca vitripennis]